MNTIETRHPENGRTLLVLAVVSLLTGPASGNDEIDGPAIEEIVVRAEIRDGVSLQEVASSVTVLDSQTLQDAAQQHFQDVMHLVPNLNWSSATSRPRYLQLRGIGERSQYEGAPNPSVGLLVDDIDFSGIGTVATMFDVEQVEVLRGPQGTRYGANALAGLVYIRTAEPQAETEHRIESLFADNDGWSLGYSGTGALNDDGSAAWRVSLHQYQDGGFHRNDFLDRQQTNDRDEFSLRTKLRFAPSDEIDLDFTLLAAEVDNGFDAFAPENSFVVHSDKPGRDAQQTAGAAMRARWSGGSAADLVSITTLSDSDILYSFDGDWGNDEYWGEFSPYDFTSETRRERQAISQELRWVSKPGHEWFGGRSRWLTGLYLQQLDEANRFEDLFNGDLFRLLESDYEARTLAAFGQLDTRLAANAELSVGLRVERRDARYRDTAGLDLDPAESMFGGHISLSNELQSGRTAYVTLSRGYKAGGFNLGLSVPEQRREYGEESLLNLEAGVKGAFADGRLQASVALFHAWRDDIQVETSFQSDPTDPLTFVFFTDNAASGSNFGLEVEGRWYLTDEWQLFGSLGLLDASFDNFNTAERDLSGREQAHAPGYQAVAGVEYRNVGGWFARADLFAQDAFFFSDSHDQRSEAYQLMNFKLGFEAERWAIYAWARNVADERFATRGFYFGLEPPDYPTRLYLQQGDPRQLGISARFHF